MVDSKSFNFSFPNRVGDANLKVALAANSPSPFNSNFTINASGMSNQTTSISGISGSYNKANLKVFENTLSPSGDNIQLTLDFSSSSPSGKGWIDYIEINTERDLKMYGSQMSFRSLASVQSNSVTEFQLSNTNSSTRIWDVTQALNPQSINGQIQLLSFPLKSQLIL